MDFLDRLREASFDGVPFRVDTDEVTEGPRVTVHEIVDGEDVPEALGVQAPTLSVTAYLTGDDYAAKRDRLIDALKRSADGARRLVLPDREPILAIAGAFTSRQSFGPNAEGGIARLEIPFFQAPRTTSPIAQDDTTQAARDQADRLRQAAEDAFDAMLRTEGFADSVFDAAAQRVSTLAAALERGASRVGGSTQDVAALARDAAQLAADPEGTVQAAATGALGLGPLYDRLARIAGDARRAFDTIGDLRTVLSGVTVPTATTVTTRQVAENEEAFQDFSRRAALAARVRVAVDLPLASAQDAAALRDQIAADIDDELEAATDDTVYVELQALLAKVAGDLDARAARLPTRRVLVLDGLTCSLSLAYRLYGDLERESELIERNALLHPAFVPAGRAIEYLVRG